MHFVTFTCQLDMTFIKNYKCGGNHTLWHSKRGRWPATLTSVHRWISLIPYHGTNSLGPCRKKPPVVLTPPWLGEKFRFLLSSSLVSPIGCGPCAGSIRVR